jgi:hypothetical protein
MRKVAFVVGAGITNLLVTASAALADSSLPGPNDTNVGGEVVTPPGGTAFTGSDILLLVAVAAVVLAVGIALFVTGRRRAASTS